MNHSNSYVPIYTKPKDRDFLSYYDDLKYDAALKNPDTYIKNVVVKILTLFIMNVGVVS